MKAMMRVPAVCLLLILGVLYFALALVALVGMLADKAMGRVDAGIARIGDWGIRGHG